MISSAALQTPTKKVGYLPLRYFVVVSETEVV